MKPRVVTTFLPGYCFARNVAGELAVVENLLPANVSLHDYQLSPADLRKLNGADLIVINGLGMESFLKKALENVAEIDRKLVDMSAGLESECIREDGPDEPEKEGHDHSVDPHIWLDPILARRCVTNVAEALGRADPKNAAVYRRNAGVYGERLGRLHEELEARLAAVRGIPFITYHNAFRYFARRYGLRLVGVVERVPEVAPSPRERQRLAELIRREKVRALFSEPGGGARLARQIARDAKIALGELDPLESGALEAESYEKGMRKNAEALVKVLSP